MAVLSTSARKKLPKGDFAVPSKAPGSGSYPVPDAAHARNALARVAQFGTNAQKSAVKKKASKKFPGIGKKKGNKPSAFFGE